MKNLGAEHENLDQKAYEIVKNMITERQILPGEKIGKTRPGTRYQPHPPGQCP
jgi:DNA-binding GntR family transcriptional regulator